MNEVWLVEAVEGYGSRYMAVVDERILFVPEPAVAVRFAREHDATQMCRAFDGCLPVKHLFVDIPPEDQVYPA